MEPFKELLSFEKSKIIAKAVKRVYPNFKEQEFLRNIKDKIPQLELKQRMETISQALIEFLPSDVETLFPILIRSARNLNGFLVWPHTHVIVLKGLNHVDLSMNALYEMTQVFTAEFAIRDFLILHREATLKILKSWLNDPSEHVRRLISEGTRPLLPWGKKLEVFAEDPKITWHLLESLRHDPSPYVRKSVANHLNDHSKNHPDWLLKNLGRWQRDKSKDVDWIIRHASRTLIKKGHLKALALQGVKPLQVRVSKFTLKPKQLNIGKILECRITLKNLERNSAKVVIDQEVGFLKKNGDTSPKVFKGKMLELIPGESTDLVLKLPLRQVTTRVYYPGKHTYTLILNGKRLKSLSFVLKI